MSSTGDLEAKGDGLPINGDQIRKEGQMKFDDISLNDDPKSNGNDKPEDVNLVDINSHDQVTTVDSGGCNNRRHSSGEESTGSTPLGELINSNGEDVSEDEAKRFESLKKKNGILDEVNALEEKYESKIISLQLERDELRNVIEDLRVKITEQEKQFNETKARMNASLDKVNRQAESSRKELESMVIKYATSEKEVIVVRKTKEECERKLRDALRDKESLMVRIKGLSNEKSQLMSVLDKKVVEISTLQRDFDKLKEDLKDRDYKWKTTQAKLKEEVSAHEETQRKLEYSSIRMSELTGEVSDLKRDFKELTEKDAALFVKSDKNQIEQLQDELDNSKQKLVVLTDENHSLTVKIQTLERERLDHEQVVSKLKENINSLKSEIADFATKLSEMEQVRLQWNQEKDRVTALQKENERLKNANSELSLEMDSCRHKEGELLEFTERLTAKTVQLQSEHNLLDQKNVMLQNDLDMIKKKHEELLKEKEDLLSKIGQLNETHQNELSILAKKLASKTKLSEELKVKVDELENENRIMKKRHVTSLKELNKELSTMKKRLDHYDGQSHSVQNDKLSTSSRTSSSTSLDTLSNNNSGNHSSVVNQNQVSVVSSSNSSSSQLEQTTNEVNATNALPEVDKQLLIEKILRLQRSLARRNEKIDFLEGHNHQLMEDIKKKSKIIQNYILREETGILSTSSMDDHKKSDKKRQVAKRGGIMSSLYTTTANDSTMTLELSLEINKKLQEVLEDAILKNITLKESINTLGEEIANLKKVDS